MIQHQPNAAAFLGCTLLPILLDLPFGMTPGSINVANVKLAITKNVNTP